MLLSFYQLFFSHGFLHLHHHQYTISNQERSREWNVILFLYLTLTFVTFPWYYIIFQCCSVFSRMLIFLLFHSVLLKVLNLHSWPEPDIDYKAKLSSFCLPYFSRLAIMWSSKWNSKMKSASIYGFQRDSSSSFSSLIQSCDNSVCCWTHFLNNPIITHLHTEFESVVGAAV